MKKPRKTAKASSKAVRSKGKRTVPKSRAERADGQSVDTVSGTEMQAQAATPTPSTKIKREVIPRVQGKRPGVGTDVGWHDKFVEVFSQEPCISTACDAAGISRSTFYDHEKKFPAFAELVKEASERGVDVLERTVYLRATVGVPRKKFTAKGAPIIDPETGKQYVEYEHDGTAAIFLLKHQRPEKYGTDRSKVEVTGQVTLTPDEIVAKGNAFLKGSIQTLRAAAAAGKDKPHAAG